MSSAEATTLTPSELVLLNGERFAHKVMIGNVDLLHVEAKVSAQELAQAALAAAFLALAQAGSLRLEIRSHKALLGLRTIKALYANPGDSTTTWPAYSFEARLPELAREWQQQHQGKNLVENLVYSLLHEDSANPWQSTIELLKKGMSERGVLERVEERKLKIFITHHYILPESTQAQRLRQPVEPVARLLDEAEKGQPELWKMLVTAIKQAIKLRTEQSDDGD
jgi:hypothetical protein